MALLIALLLSVAEAHTFEAAYLALDEADGNAFDVRFKVPREAEYVSGAGLSLILPCEGTPSRIHCPDGLVGEIGIDGLTGLDGIVHISWKDGREVIASIGPDRPTVDIEEAASTPVPSAYIGLGVEHILLGFDHLLFVLGLAMLMGARVRRLLGTLTAFTVGHSLTLGLSALGMFSLSPAAVEACIALSVVLLAREVVLDDEGLVQRRPWLVAAGFGLLHGLGVGGTPESPEKPAHYPGRMGQQ